MAPIELPPGFKVQMFARVDDAIRGEVRGNGKVCPFAVSEFALSVYPDLLQRQINAAVHRCL